MELLNQIFGSPIHMTSMGVAIGVGLSGFWAHMNQRLKQPIVDAEASRIRDESALLAVQKHNEMATMLRQELESQLEAVKEQASQSAKMFENRIKALENIITFQKHEIEVLKNRNQTLEADNRELNERYKQLLDRIESN